MFEFLSANSLYIVLAIALVVWLGIYAYLFRMEKQLNKLETEIKGKK